MDLADLSLQEVLPQRDSDILHRSEYTLQIAGERNEATGTVADGWGRYTLRFEKGDWKLTVTHAKREQMFGNEHAVVHQETFLVPAQFPTFPEEFTALPLSSKYLRGVAESHSEDSFRTWFRKALARGENRVLFSDLEDSVPGLRVSFAGGHLPFQSEGWLQGLLYNFTYRRGEASLLVGENLREPMYEAHMKFGGPYDGSLDKKPDGNFSDVFKGLVRSLVRSKFKWEFEITHNENAPEAIRGAGSILPLRGHTPEEAAYYILNPKTENQKAAATFDLNPVPLNQDTRVFPNPEPQFMVVDPFEG